MALGIFHQSGGLVKPHGLIVEHGSGERGEVMAFQKRAGKSKQRENGGVRFWKSVEGEGRDGLDDGVLSWANDSVFFHAAAQFHFDFFHAFFGAFETEGAAELFGFATGEAGGNHGDAKKLFLKKRDAQGAFEHRFERRM